MQELQIGGTSEVSVRRVRGEPRKLHLTQMHESRVVAGLEVDFRRIAHSVLHNDVEAVALADRGDGTVNAIGE
jgi:hypothetical protein